MLTVFSKGFPNPNLREGGWNCDVPVLESDALLTMRQHFGQELAECSGYDHVTVEGEKNAANYRVTYGLGDSLKDPNQLKVYAGYFIARVSPEELLPIAQEILRVKLALENLGFCLTTGQIYRDTLKQFHFHVPWRDHPYEILGDKKNVPVEQLNEELQRLKDAFQWDVQTTSPALSAPAQ